MSAETMTRGQIVPIGGAEKKTRDPAILARFAQLCGGDGARLAVIPTASSLEDTGARYERLFTDIGCRVRVLPFLDRADCERAELIDPLHRADGVFFTGGNQLKLTTILGGTSVADLLRERNKSGLHVAGTSAGASFCSEHMIAHGKEGATPREGMVQLVPGLGLSPHTIIDQHFRQRDRLGRLLAALAYNPRPVGIGLDEDTAAFLGPDDVLTVRGTGAITVVDAGGMTHSTMDTARHGEPVSMLGVRLHVLSDGDTFNLVTREACLAEDSSEEPSP